MRLRKWKKFAPHLIILATLIGIAVPTLGAHLLNELTPYLNLTSVTAKPESVELDSIAIVDKKYDKYTVESLNSNGNKSIQVKYPIWEIEGIYLQSDYGKKGAPNYYNSLVLVHNNIIDLSKTPLQGSGEIPVVVKYYIREWTEITWCFSLKVNNRGDDNVIFPRGNLTMNYLDDTLAKGWINREYEIKGHDSKTVKIYFVMKNDRFTETFITAMILGYPLELTIDFEAYILAEGQNDEPLVPIIYSIDMDFALPGSSRGPAPFIHSITRTPVSANQPVKISVSGSDEGTGISNRTYIYYSIDGGASWDISLLTGGEWWNEYARVPFYNEKVDAPRVRYPILSTLQAELYEGEIPSFPAGTEVLFKIYLEDYAANIDHVDKGNWVWSQIYSYIVPAGGVLPEFTVEFKKETEKTDTQKVNDYLELNGFIQDYFLYINDIYTDIMTKELFPYLAAYLYKRNVDAAYAMIMLLVHPKKMNDILADSGLSSVRLLVDVMGVPVMDLFDYIVDNIFLPIKQKTTLTKYAQDILKGITIIDDIQGLNPQDLWYSSPSGTVDKDQTNYLKIGKDRIGDKSIKWTVATPANLSDNLLIPKDLSKKDILSFYLDYNDHTRLNGNLSVTLIDNNGRKMTSKQIYFEETTSGTFQEITLGLNSKNFEIDPGFNFGEIHQINFTYSGTEAVTLNIDYILAYSARSYNLHQYLTYVLNIKSSSTTSGNSIFTFKQTIYLGTATVVDDPVDNTRYPILQDWESNQDFTGGWNFIDLVATNGTIEYDYGPGPNGHIAAAATFLQWFGYPNGYKKLCELFGAEIEEFDEEPFTKEEIYPYTQSLTTFMVYIPLGAVAALAIVLQVRKYRYKTKVKKIRTKYKKKIGKW